MDKAITLLTKLTFFLICLWGLKFELSSIENVNYLRTLDSNIAKYFSSAPTWSREDTTELLSTYEISDANSPKNQTFPKRAFELGRVKLLLSAKVTNPEDKIKLICESQALFNSALQNSPRNIDFNLALADIESLSRLLPTACNNSNDTKLSVQERLKLVSHLGPYETNGAYKSALIYRALGDNMEAMKQFRLFEEHTHFPREDIRSFIIALSTNSKELQEAIPRRYPSVLLWLRDYKTLKGDLKEDSLSAFEVAIQETIDSIVEKVKDGELKENKLEEVLLTIYQDPITRISSPIRKRVTKLLFEYYVINDNTHAKKLMEALSEREKLPLSATKEFSTKSRRSASAYDWYPYNSNKQINLDVRSEGLGLFLDNTKTPDLFVMRGSNGNVLPKNIRVEIWESEDNLDYSLTKDNIITESGLIGGKQSLYFFPGEIRSHYVKIYFKFSGEHYNPAINGPINSLIEAFYQKGGPR